MKHILVIAPTYTEAQQLLADYRWQHRNQPHLDWTWIVSAHLARLWLIRCRRRGVEIDPVWVTADTAERRAAA